MRFVLFCHSLASDWNHGNAHFLRGVADELVARRHAVVSWEPSDGWSRSNLVAEHGELALDEFAAAYPALDARTYGERGPDLELALDGADVVLVHEWTPPELVQRIGAALRGSRTRVLFHDTHHRSVTEPAAMAALDLRDYDGVLAFGAAVAARYREHGWAARAWVWHEAADVRRFRPREAPREGDLVWIGNWGDDERTAELHEFLLEPVRSLGLRARVHGVRYPPAALEALRRAGIEYRGWLANHRVPEAFARHRCTVHVPRGAYARDLPGIPTIRMFEALACGMPLVSAPWDDAEHLFRPDEDYLVATDGDEMREHLRMLLADPDLAARIGARGRATILARHTCAHRVDELLAIVESLDARHPDALPRASGLALRDLVASVTPAAGA